MKTSATNAPPISAGRQRTDVFGMYLFKQAKASVSARNAISVGTNVVISPKNASPPGSDAAQSGTVPVIAVIPRNAAETESTEAETATSAPPNTRKRKYTRKRLLQLRPSLTFHIRLYASSTRATMKIARTARTINPIVPAELEFAIVLSKRLLANSCNSGATVATTVCPDSSDAASAAFCSAATVSGAMSCIVSAMRSFIVSTASSPRTFITTPKIVSTNITNGASAMSK